MGAIVIILGAISGACLWEAYRSSRKQKRGFAAMTPERRRQIASMGGKAAHAKGTAYKFKKKQND